MTEYEEAMMQFAVEADVPNEDTIAQYCALYPQYTEQIKKLAKELQEMYFQEDVEIALTPEQEKQLDEDLSRLMFNFYEAMYKHRGQKIGNA
jgi:Spy/CpxP family protein refolding chaperone